MKLIAKSLPVLAVSGGAQMAGQMRMSLNTVYVTDNPTISMDIDNPTILCYATCIIVIHSLWIKMIAADKAVNISNEYPSTR